MLSSGTKRSSETNEEDVNNAYVNVWYLLLQHLSGLLQPTLPIQIKTLSIFYGLIIASCLSLPHEKNQLIVLFVQFDENDFRLLFSLESGTKELLRLHSHHPLILMLLVFTRTLDCIIEGRLYRLSYVVSLRIYSPEEIAVEFELS